MAEQKDQLDLIWGVGPIGREIGRTYKQTYHMIQCGYLPAVKQVGGRYVASRRKLIEFFMKEAAA
ncbi:hypothetical protein [Rhizobium rhizophilum]|uniref:DNA-binding protein n=1 Tax=Rhizobium rhizophilum TaxID=1850373 RepID=A0ABY2QU47_9HYPH|nr:hypothetical protein [Rhizobium rhizophilum]THV13848.1 hypothetical protein E9677_13185 [Rhizobium rhizophilum]